MKTRRLVAMLALVLSFAAAVFVGAQVTLAYVTVETPALVNTFVPGDVPTPGATSVTLQVEKTVISSGSSTLSPEGFIFEIVNDQTGDKYQLVADAQGHAALTLTYTMQDLGKAFTYTITEKNDARADVTYDTTAHKLVVAVSLDRPTDTLIATATLNGTTTATPTAAFTNHYTPTAVVPPMGDEENLLLYALLMLCGAAGLVIFTRKRIRP